MRVLAWILAFAVSPVAAADDGAALFQSHCAACHGSPSAPMAPGREALKHLRPEEILKALVSGSMAAAGNALSMSEKREVAQFTSGKRFIDLEADVPASAFCARAKFRSWNPLSGPAWRDWGVDLNNTRFQPAKEAGLSAADLPRLKLKWAFGFRNSVQASSQPVVVGGRVFVGSQSNEVYSLDAGTGCIHWRVPVDAGVRNAVAVGPVKGAKYGIFFGDLDGNVYGLDAASGTVLWRRRIDDQPFLRITGSVRYLDGRLYVPVTTTEEAVPTQGCCRSRGAVIALDAASGKEFWKSYTIAEKARAGAKTANGKSMWGPAGVGVWNSPALDPKRSLLYFGTGNSTAPPESENSDSMLALALQTGKIRWHRKFTKGDLWNNTCLSKPIDPASCPNPDAPDEDFGSGLVLAQASGGKAVLLGPQKSGLNAVDPENGTLLWQLPGENTHWGIAVAGETAYVPRGEGGLDAIDVGTGKKLWHAAAAGCEGRKPCHPGESAAVTAIPGAVLSGTIDGRVRAYSAQDGKLLWEYDSAREFDTVNGIPAHGGTIDGAGASVAGKMVFLTSGYGKPVPGNVLLAFSLEGH